MAADRAEQVPTIVVRAGEGELVLAGGVEHLFKLTGAHTGGRLGVERFVVPPVTVGAAPHVHHAHDEHFYVLSGELTVSTADGEVVLGAGDLASAPRGSVHAYRNASTDEPAVGLCLYTPPGYEQFFRDVQAATAAGSELTPALLSELRGRHDTDTV